MSHNSIGELIEEILALAKEKGFGTKPEEINVAEKIALIHSEVAEAYDAYRQKNIDGKDGFKEELADIVIRTLHLAGAMGVDIEAEILKKMEHNRARNWEWDSKNESHT